MTSADEGARPAQEAARRAYDKMARAQRQFATPVDEASLRDPLATVDPCGWLGTSIRGQRLLCLAAGGGRQSILYAAAGARVTVVDISAEMLRLDREVAHAHGLDVNTVQTSMCQMDMLTHESFDIVIQPVSTCYVEDLQQVYRQVARVIAAGGIYISQHKSPVSLQAEVRPGARGYALIEPYYRTGPLPPVTGTCLREEGTLEYLHRWEQLLGGLCRAGFVIEDLREPNNADVAGEPGSLGHRSQFIAPYVRVKGRRLGHSPRLAPLWLPADSHHA